MVWWCVFVFLTTFPWILFLLFLCEFFFFLIGISKTLRGVNGTWAHLAIIVFLFDFVWACFCVQLCAREQSHLNLDCICKEHFHFYTYWRKEFLHWLNEFLQQVWGTWCEWSSAGWPCQAACWQFTSSLPPRVLLSTGWPGLGLGSYSKAAPDFTSPA